jgi:transketolase C-terminal domain/subunit
MGAGRDRDYEHDGFSHYAGDDGIFRQLKNIQCCWPGDTDEMTLTFQAAIRAKMPYYINLTRG